MSECECECGNRLIRHPDGTMPGRCEACDGNTSMRRRHTAPPDPAAVPDRAPGPEPLTDDEISRGRTGVAAARQALRATRV